MSSQDQVQAFLAAHDVQIAVLPEADVNVSSGLSFCNEWRARGHFAALSSPEAGLSKVALVSSIPLKQVTLSAGEATTRHVAALVDLVGPDGRVEPLLVVGVYLQSGDEPTAAGQAEDLVQLAFHSGFRFLVLGDFNLEQTHPVIADCVLAGAVHRCDDCFPGALPPTGPVFRGSRRRRIDFGLAHCQWPALSVETLEGPSDHLVVAYKFDATAPKLRRGPRRRQVDPHISFETLEAQSELWDDTAFNAACCVADTDRAWQILSDWGEELLCEIDPEAVPRSSDWLPAEPTGRCTGKRPERSASLRALLKLLSRLRACQAQPHNPQIWHRTARSLANVRRMVPELPHISRADGPTVALVEALVNAYSEQERQAAKQAWRRITRDSLPAARAYVKRKADQISEWDNTSAEDRALTTGRHPAVEVDRQAKDWTTKSVRTAGMPWIF